MGDPLRTYIDALRLLARTHDPNRVVLIRRNIDRYLEMESGERERGLERLRVAIHNEEAEGGEWEDWSVARDYVRSLLRRMVNAQRRTVRLQLYGLVQGLSYAVRLNDLKTAQHFRARLAWALRGPNNLAKRLHGDLKELFEISGLWVRNVGKRHALKLQIQRLIRRIIRRVKIQRRNRRPVRRRLT